MGRYVAWGAELVIVILVALTILMLPLFAAAQRSTQVRRIAFLVLSAPPSASVPPTHFANAFQHELRERGWVEGHNLIIERRYAEGSLERFATLAAEVTRLQVELIVVPNVRTAKVVLNVTTTIPIIVLGAGEIVKSGLVASMTRPGGNVTGISSLYHGVSAKRLELLKQAIPRATRVAVLGGPARQRPTLRALDVAAQALGVTLHLFEVREPTEFDSVFAAMTTARVEALFVVGDPFWTAYRIRLADLAVQHQLPSSCSRRIFAEAGCLMSYGVPTPWRAQRVASYIDRILRGASPGDLPVEQPIEFELVINLKTAKALGITMPPILLFQADEVVR